MKTQIGWTTLGVLLAATMTVSAAEVSKSEYIAPKTEAPRAEATTRVTAQATVEKIDYSTRMIALKNESGETTEMKVGPEVQRFSEIKKGDIVKVEYLQSEALYVKKAAKGEKPVDEAGVTGERMQGEQPAAVMAGAEKVSAEVVKVDYKKRMITLKDSKGNVSTMAVPDAVKRLNEIKKGDHIVAERTVAMAISVEKP